MALSSCSSFCSWPTCCWNILPLESCLLVGPAAAAMAPGGLGKARPQSVQTAVAPLAAQRAMTLSGQDPPQPRLRQPVRAASALRRLTTVWKPPSCFLICVVNRPRETAD